MRRVLTWGLTCPSPILTRLKWRKLTHVRCLLSVPATCLMLYISFCLILRAALSGGYCDYPCFTNMKAEAQSGTDVTPTISGSHKISGRQQFKGLMGSHHPDDAGTPDQFACPRVHPHMCTLCVDV